MAALPAISHDLYLVIDGSLKVWRHDNGAVDILLEASHQQTDEVGSSVGAITHVRFDAAGHSLVAARQTAADPPAYTLIWLDLSSGVQREIVSDLNYLIRLELAPAGDQIAYILGDPTSLDDVGNGYLYPYRGTVYVKELPGSQSPQPVGTCTNVNLEGELRSWPGCTGLLWSADNEQLLWSDARGVWAYQADSGADSLLQPNAYHLGDGFEANVYVPLDWSPSGRYLRLSVGHYEGGSETILDLETRTLIDIPFSRDVNGYPEFSKITWMQDDRLFIVRTEGFSDEPVSFAEIWRLAPEEKELQLEQSLDLSLSPDAFINQAAQLNDGTFVFAAFSSALDDDSRGLYLLPDLHSAPHKTNALPPDVRLEAMVIWAADGSEALVAWYTSPHSPQFNGLTYDFVYVRPDENHFYEVRQFLGHAVDREGSLLQLWWDNATD
ncbi:MAG: hypothetical protein KDE04_06385 [Anaerolineales bacterium]|nr:hypothetical protein [Anaerolineales bacterium]